MKFVTPKAFLIAETMVHHEAMSDALKHLEVETWTTDAPNDAQKLMEFAGKSCYLSFDSTLNENLTRTGTRSNGVYLQDGIIGHGHGSVLEHATVTFFISNVSRVVTHEIIRHRAGTAFSQTSGRYVRTDELEFYMPLILKDYPGAQDVFIEAGLQMEANVRKLVEITGIKDTKFFDLKKKLTSAFRRIIGNGQTNHIVLTANHRAWRHMIEMRTSRHAEEEVRLVMGDIFFQLRAKFPDIYSDASVVEVDGLHEVTFSSHKV